MGITIVRGLTPFHSRDNNLMRKLILASSVALLALSGAALATERHGRGYQVQTGTVSGQFDYTKTYTNFDKLTNTQTRNDYNGFQGFTSAFVLSNGTGGPVDSTLMYTLNLYIKGFVELDMGYASAMAWVFLLTIGLITAVLFGTGRFWVHYSDAGER